MARKLLSLIVLSFVSLGLLAQCEGGRYQNMIFPDFELSSDVQYGSNQNYQGTDQDLFLDIYQPANDTEASRPLIVVCHGGFFVSGSKTGNDVVPFCQDMARMGYVVASVQYRLGVPITTDLQQPMAEAVVRGLQDTRAAIRFFRKDFAEDGNNYGIDPDKIFVAGVSAGGFNALHTAYLDLESEFPEIVDFDNPGLSGGLEGNSGNAGYSSSVNGVINIAGALSDPEIMNNNDTPVCSFHGTGDSVVPFGTDMLSIQGIIDVDTVHGSQTVYQKAEALGIENCFTVQWLEGHVPHEDDAQHYDTLRSVSSNFLSSLVCPDIELDCNYRELDIVSSIEDLQENEVSFKIWPNPASDRLYLSSEQSYRTHYNILDLTGESVLKGFYTEPQGIDLRSLPEGLYLIRLENQLGTKTLRFHRHM